MIRSIVALAVAVSEMFSTFLTVALFTPATNEAVSVSVPAPPSTESAEVKVAFAPLKEPSKVSLPDVPVKLLIPVVSVKVWATFTYLNQ